METEIRTPEDLGRLVRAIRKAQKVRMDDLAGVGPVFVRDLERGKPTAQIGRVMQVLAELGIRLVADVPDSLDDRDA
ncbi:MAG TPA: transcriptional regulator [Lysobacter sp.]|jgi:hypothetical protein|nr:transcriptional regulator [Lysobacter sp.]